MARLIESIVLSVILSIVAIAVVNNLDRINYALNKDSIDPLADKPNYDASEIEQEVHGLVNQERVSAGLGPLDWDPALNAIAREHSRDMAVSTMSICKERLLLKEVLRQDTTAQNILIRI